jgi:hypothetical protein
MRKTILSPHALHILIEREFHQRQPRPFGFRCCSAPMPFYRKPPKEGCSNWQIRTSIKCARGCDSVLMGIREHLKAEYDIDAGNPAA